jgi:hypothetical protein
MRRFQLSSSHMAAKQMLLRENPGWEPMDLS